jgi:uncharacterized protein YcsI (UPF0317 family)
MNAITHRGGTDLRQIADPAALRRLIRHGAYTGRTGGLAMGRVQANLAIMPAAHADDFLRYCQRNPKPCPLLAVSEPGDPSLPQLGAGIDVRTDIPRYSVFRDGELAEEVHDIRGLWRKDFVAFALGCSYSFEQAIIEAGLRLHHIDARMGPPRYTCSIDTVAAGPFSGKMVVTLRAFPPADAIRAIQVTSRFPMVHGAPVHMGNPRLIGIDDLYTQCDSTFIPYPEDEEIPLFWACGVTPQVAAQAARLPLFISHTPAHMLICDTMNSALAAF